MHFLYIYLFEFCLRKGYLFFLIYFRIHLFIFINMDQHNFLCLEWGVQSVTTVPYFVSQIVLRENGHLEKKHLEQRLLLSVKGSQTPQRELTIVPIMSQRNYGHRHVLIPGMGSERWETSPQGTCSRHDTADSAFPSTSSNKWRKHT